MRKCLILNVLEPTIAKRHLLRETYETFLSMVREALSASNGVRSRAELHQATYRSFMEEHHVASQIVIEAKSYAWSVRKIVNEGISKCVIRFDRRLFSFKRTKRNNPVFSLRRMDSKDHNTWKFSWRKMESAHTLSAHCLITR